VVSVWATLRAIRERVRHADDVDLLEHAPVDIYDLLRAVETVLVLHDGAQDPAAARGRFYCSGCPESMLGRVPWPCPTRTAVENALADSELRV
jgi:hypothetical protein